MDDGTLDRICERLERLVGLDEVGDEWIRPVRTEATQFPHQCVFFLRPEATAINLDVHVRRVLDLLAESLHNYRVGVGAIRLLNSRYLRNFRIIEQHYGVISRIAREGRAALSDAAESELARVFGEELDRGAIVLGAKGFLSRFSRISPFALNVLSDNLPKTKLASGTYAAKVTLAGASYIILNAFDPFQLEHFTSPGKALIIFEGLCDTSWKVLRQEWIGATNPTNATAGSLRRKFLEQKEQIGMSEVTQGTNGIHLSAGPLEGMIEYRRFFSDHTVGVIPFENTVFGRLLISRGLAAQSIEALSGNPTFLQEGRRTSAFDLTEECDAIEAAQKLVPLVDTQLPTSR